MGLAPLPDFLIGLTWIVGKQLFVLLFIFYHRNIDCVRLLSRNLLLNLVIFVFLVLNWVGIALENIRELKLIKIEHVFSE